MPNNQATEANSNRIFTIETPVEHNIDHVAQVSEAVHVIGPIATRVGNGEVISADDVARTIERPAVFSLEDPVEYHYHQVAQQRTYIAEKTQLPDPPEYIVLHVGSIPVQVSNSPTNDDNEVTSAIVQSLK